MIFKRNAVELFHVDVTKLQHDWTIALELENDLHGESQA